MKICDSINKKNTLSFEVFPPKDDQPLDELKETLLQLQRHNPDFISVTYGAGGTNVGRSIEVSKMVEEMGSTPLQHFTCIGNTKEDIDKFTEEYKNIGVENLLLLRGDFKKGEQETGGDFEHATDMIKYFSENHPEFCIGGAAYPETHIESDSAKADIRFLKDKQELGAKFLVTQLCFDAGSFERWLKKIRGMGITIPVIAGVMPAITSNGIIKMCLSNGCSIPKGLSKIIGRYQDYPEDFKKAGIEFTKKLIEDIKAAGANGIHLYTLNKWKIADELEATYSFI
jgi:methylenetetrahydrofolate reductase (NADPH)